MKKLKSLIPAWVRASAEMMPLVTVWPTPKGLPDGEHQVAHFGLVGILELKGGQGLARRVDAQHREIGALVADHQFRREFPAVGQHHGDLRGALDHVMVGHHQTAGIDDDPGPERILNPFSRLAEAAEAIAEEALEEGIVEQRRESPLLHHALGVDVDHRRRDAAHHGREGKQNLLAGFGHLHLIGRNGLVRRRHNRRRDEQQADDRSAARG